MLPTSFGAGQLTGLTYNGSAISYTKETIKGVEYAFFPARAGRYQAAFFQDTEAPSVSITSPANGATRFGHRDD